MTTNGPLITNIGLFFSIFFVVVGSLDFGRLRGMGGWPVYASNE
jgi:hypothetical protein